MCTASLRKMFSGRSQRLALQKQLDDAEAARQAIANAEQGEGAAKAFDARLRRLQGARGVGSTIYGGAAGQPRSSVTRAVLLGQAA